MCKHCDLIVEDVESKPIVHAFAVDAAAKVQRRLRELGRFDAEVGPDDIEISVTVPESFRPSGRLAMEAGCDIARVLLEMHR